MNCICDTFHTGCAAPAQAMLSVMWENRAFCTEQSVAPQQDLLCGQVHQGMEAQV